MKYYNENYKKEIKELINNTFKSIEAINNIGKKIKTKGDYDVDNLGNEAFEKEDLIVRGSCGRKFKKDNIEKHQNICFKHPYLFRNDYFLNVLKLFFFMNLLFYILIIYIIVFIIFLNILYFYIFNLYY